MAFFSCLPPIPAVNRWGKLAGPVAWWLGASSFYSVMPQVLLLAREQMGGAEEADPITAATVGLGEPETEAHVRLVRQTRWKKALQVAARQFDEASLVNLLLHHAARDHPYGESVV